MNRRAVGDQASRVLLALSPGFLFICFWQSAVAGSDRRQFLFGSPKRFVEVAVTDTVSGEIFTHFGITLTETLLGLLLGSLLGTLLGLVLWADQRVAFVMQPYIVILGSIPVFAVAPMMIIWFGTGLLSKVVMAGFSTSIVALIQAYDGAKTASVEHLRMARLFGATRFQILRKIVVPSSLLWVVVGFRLNIGFALIGAFIGEFVSSEAGLGHYILKASGTYDVPRVLFGIFLMASMGLLLTGTMSVIERRWFPWVRFIQRGK